MTSIEETYHHYSKKRLSYVYKLAFSKIDHQENAPYKYKHQEQANYMHVINVMIAARVALLKAAQTKIHLEHALDPIRIYDWHMHVSETMVKIQRKGWKGMKLTIEQELAVIEYLTHHLWTLSHRTRKLERMLKHNLEVKLDVVTRILKEIEEYEKSEHSAKIIIEKFIEQAREELTELLHAMHYLEKLPD